MKTERLDEFEAEAEKELAELMCEVSEHDRRHGPRPRRLDQDISLVTATLGALELQRRDLLADGAEGYMVWPSDLTTLCMTCHEPDPRKRQDISRLAIREAFELFREEHGRAASTEEMIAWLSENVGGERGRLHLVGHLRDEDDAD